MHWTDDYPVMLVKEHDYAIMEVELYEGRIIIQPIYTASSAGEAELITKAIKELDPVAKELTVKVIVEPVGKRI